MFDETFLRAIKGQSETALRSLIIEVHQGVYSFRMLNLDFCKYRDSAFPHVIC